MYYRFLDDEIPALGAQMTYYLLLSFFPFSIFIITIISYTPVTTYELLQLVSAILPSNTYEIIEDLIKNVMPSRSTTLLSFGMASTLWSASNGVKALIRGINKAYNQEENRPFWKVRGLSLLFTLALSFIIAVSFIMLIFGELLGNRIFTLYLPSSSFKTVWDVVRYVFTAFTMLFVFILLYYYTPNVRLKIKKVIPGSVFSTLGWLITSELFSFYVNNFTNYSNAYGSIGGIIVLLLWLYIISIIILTGGELNASLAFASEGKKKPKGKNFGILLIKCKRE